MNPDKFGNLSNWDNVDKSNVVKDLDLEISKLVIESGKLDKVVIPGGVKKLVNPVNPVKLGIVVIFDEFDRFKLLREAGNWGNSVNLPDRFKPVRLVNPDKSDKPVNPVNPDKSNVVINDDLETSKDVREAGKLCNVRSPEGVVKLLSCSNRIKSSKPVNPDNVDKSNVIKDLDLEISKLVIEEGNWGNPVIPPGGVIKRVNLVNPDKSGIVVTYVYCKLRSVKEYGRRGGNSLIAGGATKRVRFVNPDNISDKSSLVMFIDPEISKLCIE